MRKGRLAQGEYYHVYNRGVEKRLIFVDDRDRWRFMTLLCILQGKAVMPNMRRAISLVQHSMLNKEILENRLTSLVSFCLMPNHFHLILHAENKAGISKFMQRLGNAYTKYFNLRYQRSGHLFGGRFQFSHIDRNEYLLHLSAYIHLNPGELKSWHGKELSYPWSSFQDYVSKNRWGPFLERSIILGQFQRPIAYKSFIRKSGIEKSKKLLAKPIFNRVQH